MFKSELKDFGPIEPFPTFAGVRIMMMPFLLEDVATIPDAFGQWRRTVGELLQPTLVPRSGTAYLTIDEALVKAGETHRRPGLHVDGIGPEGKEAAYGGGGGYGSWGMITAASVAGCNAFVGDFEGYPGSNGDCTHLGPESAEKRRVLLQAGRAYWLGPMTVHESFPMRRDTHRQFVRISMPSEAPWYEGYTENPLGIKPTGPIHPPRTQFMGYRP